MKTASIHCGRHVTLFCKSLDVLYTTPKSFGCALHGIHSASTLFICPLDTPTKFHLHKSFYQTLYLSEAFGKGYGCAVDFECGDKNNGDFQRLSFLKKRRKLYQHGEKEIKLLRLRDHSKTRSLLTLWILNMLRQ